MPFINDGEPVNVVEISTGLSLGVIIGVLLVTVVASLLSPKGRAQNAVANARGTPRRTWTWATKRISGCGRRHSRRCCSEERGHPGLPEKYRRRIRDEHEVMDLLRRAHDVKDQRVAAGYGRPRQKPTPRLPAPARRASRRRPSRR